MNTFRHNFTLGVIKEVGENDVLVTINGNDVEIQLDDSNREPILNGVAEGLFIVPVDAEKNILLMNIDEQTLHEVFPEFELEELQGADDDEHKFIDDFTENF